MLSHHSDIDGESIIQPSEALIRFLDRVIETVTQPPKALDCATLFADILKATPNQRVQTVMKKMERQGFSHVPVIENSKFIGVFSIGTIFQYSLSQGMSSMNDDMLISDFAEYIPIEKHKGEKFIFLSADTSIYEARSEFEKNQQRSRRLAVIFITDNGSSEGRILGMITPWDVIHY